MGETGDDKQFNPRALQVGSPSRREKRVNSEAQERDPFEPQRVDLGAKQEGNKIEKK